jgi:uncharacterized membrane protein
MTTKVNPLNVVAALAGAISLAALATPSAADTIEGMEKCYGISEAGQNSCGGAGHDCAGMSTVDYSGQDFRVVKEGTCEAQGGQLEAFEGTNPNKKT